jgi:hypothetical protein
MKIRFDNEGLVEGGVECLIEKDKVLQSEIVFDLTNWIQRQFLELREEAEHSKKSGGRFLAYKHLWIGEGRPFALVEARNSKFVAFCVHPELRDGDWHFESSDAEKVSAFVANKATRVSQLNW